MSKGPVLGHPLRVLQNPLVFQYKPVPERSQNGPGTVPVRSQTGLGPRTGTGPVPDPAPVPDRSRSGPGTVPKRFRSGPGPGTGPGPVRTPDPGPVQERSRSGPGAVPERSRTGHRTRTGPGPGTGPGAVLDRSGLTLPPWPTLYSPLCPPATYPSLFSPGWWAKAHICSPTYEQPMSNL